MKKIIYFAMVIVFASCAQTPAKSVAEDHKFFCGMFTYFADAATFVDCATGVSYPVSNQGEYLSAEREYKNLGVHPMEAAFIEFTGDIISETDQEAGTRKTMRIDNVIQLERERTCSSEMGLTGPYIANMSDQKHNLKLNSDYTYKEVILNNTEHVREVNGVWYRTALLELVLIPNDSKETEKLVLEIIPALTKLVKTNGGEPLNYDKVFL